MAQKQYEEAARLGLDALAVSPVHRAALLTRVGIALRGKGDADAAIEYLTKALRAAPGNGAAHLNLAEIYEIGAQLDKAAAHYRQYLRLPANPRHKAAVRRRLQAMRKASQPAAERKP